MNLDIASPLSDDPAVLADLLFDTKSLRLLMAKETALVETREKAIEEKLIAIIPATSSGAMGKHHKVKVETADKWIMNTEKWPDFFAYVANTGSFDLLQKRLADRAVADRMEEGVKIPGVENMKVKKISLTKI